MTLLGSKISNDLDNDSVAVYVFEVKECKDYIKMGESKAGSGLQESKDHVLCG